jgi:hypothetical protein
MFIKGMGFFRSVKIVDRIEPRCCDQDVQKYNHALAQVWKISSYC